MEEDDYLFFFSINLLDRHRLDARPTTRTIVSCKIISEVLKSFDIPTTRKNRINPQRGKKYT